MQVQREIEKIFSTDPPKDEPRYEKLKIIAGGKIDLPVKYDSLDGTNKWIIRGEYAKRQKNICYECGENLSDPPAQYIIDHNIRWGRFPPNFLKYPVHLHHDHKTGLTIGVTHARCNAYLFDVKGE